MQESVLIVGAGSGLSASLARLCKSKGMKVVLAARDVSFDQGFNIGDDCMKKMVHNIAKGPKLGRIK